MSHNPTVLLDGDTSSSNTSASRNEVNKNDSLNSLIEGSIDRKECIDISCSMANQCSPSCNEANQNNIPRRSIFCNSIGQSVWGVLLMIISIGGFIFTPLDLMLWEKLNMRPGLPPYEWWATPPDEVKMRVYLFNVTNHERFLQGLDKKMNFQEIGPIVYLEKLTHSNIVFNDNDTLSYTATRRPIYLPDENTIDLNTTLIVPNTPFLSPAAKLFLALVAVTVTVGQGVLRIRQKLPYQPRRLLHLATYNIRPLRTDEKIQELEDEIDELNWSIRLSEARREGEHSIIFKSENLFYYQEDELLFQGGIGILVQKSLVNKSLVNNVVNVEGLSPRGVLSFLHDANYFLRTGVKLLSQTHQTQMFLNRTIYEYLWNFREPILETSKKMLPHMVPFTNIGMLARIYANWVDNVTVKIGPQWGHKNFFKLEKYEGGTQFPGFDENICTNTIVGSNDGVMYQQHMSKNDILLYLRTTVCKVMPLYFDEETIAEGLLVYRYNLSETVHDRVTNMTDCYAGNPVLPDGLSDASRCYNDVPMVMSFPHFYTGTPVKDTYVTGLRPDMEKHNSYALVEPITGIPFEAVARMQSNLRIHDLSGFNTPEFKKFSNLILPIGWIEYHQEGLPARIRNTIYFMVIILPPLSIIILSCMFLLGCLLMTKQIYLHKLSSKLLPKVLHLKSKNVDSLVKNKIYTFEKEAFLKNPS